MLGWGGKAGREVWWGYWCKGGEGRRNEGEGGEAENLGLGREGKVWSITSGS